LRQQQALEIDGEHDHVHLPAGRGLWRSFAPVAGLILLVLYLLSGFYIVEPGEAGVVRRYGRVIAGNIPAGLHYRLPWPVDQVDVVAVDAIRRADTPASLMLTGDENLISIRLSLHYNVTNAAAFLLNTIDPETLAAQAGEAAMRQVVAQENVDALLTVDKAIIERKAAELAQGMLDNYNAGLQVTGVQLLESSPPPEVADAFRDVSSAREDRNTFINEALAYQNEVVPLARGDAEVAIQAANAYFAEKTGEAAADATLFTNRQGAYAQAKDATRLRLYLEAIENVMPGVRKFILDESVKLETTDLWIPGNSNVQTFPVAP
jgi:membrane protease subunit HflK